MYYNLLTRRVLANIMQGVIRSGLENSGHNMDSVKLPSRSTAQKMVTEAGYLAKISASYELAKSGRQLALGNQSDGTIKQLIHWGAHALKLDTGDVDGPQMFTLTVSPVASGKADDTIRQLEQFSEMQDIGKELGLDFSELVTSLGLTHECRTVQQNCSCEKKERCT